MTETTRTFAEIDLAPRRVSKGLYHLDGAGASPLLPIEAKDATHAVSKYLQIRLFRDQAGAEAEARDREARLGTIGAALRNGGIAEIPVHLPARPFTDLATVMGFAARSHTTYREAHAVKHLLVAATEDALDALKARVDREVSKNDNPAT